MKIINFKGSNVVYGAGQEEYLPLPAHKTAEGIVTSCFKLNLWERLKTLITGRIWFSVMTFNGPLQPQLASVDKPKMGKEQ